MHGCTRGKREQRSCVTMLVELQASVGSNSDGLALSDAEDRACIRASRLRRGAYEGSVARIGSDAALLCLVRAPHRGGRAAALNEDALPSKVFRDDVSEVASPAAHGRGCRRRRLR